MLNYSKLGLIHRLAYKWWINSPANELTLTYKSSLFPSCAIDASPYHTRTLCDEITLAGGKNEMNGNPLFSMCPMFMFTRKCITS